jgi:Uma2 family endonuclease
MTLDEFLHWEDGADTRYELIGGFPVAMAPPLEGHSELSARVVARLDGALTNRRPCRALVEAGILHPERADTFFVADAAVTCAPYDLRRQHVQNPILLVEVLSSSTERHDRRIKAMDHPDQSRE